MNFEDKQKIINKLQTLRQVNPSQDFIGRFKTNLVYALSPRQSQRAPLLAARAVAFTILFIFFISSGTIYASQNSLPGQFLYPVKKTLEAVQIRLTADPQERANLQIQLTDKRLAEIQKLSKKQSSGLEKATTEYEKAVGAALENAKKSNHGGGALNQLEEKLNHHAQVLEKTSKESPSQAQGTLKKALNASQKGATRAKEAQEKNPPNNKNPRGGE
ncbi:hypothetical protein IH981_01935 [Patescibacteria group bacterium]|nr:hypothetical protein [Patescibacteria group bacterium]